jgi:hypothetical protein
MRAKQLRRVAVTIWVGLILVAVGGCSDGSDLKFDAVAGELCHNCEDCAGIVNSCICETCTEYAVDAKRKQMLVCTGIWKVYKECPGGVSVSCADKGYNATCLDKDGQPI